MPVFVTGRNQRLREARPSFVTTERIRMMKISYATLATTMLLAASGLAHAALPAGDVPTKGDRPPLELKGIKLGDDLAAVKAALPEATCETLPDTLLEQCWQPEGATLGGKPAEMLVRLFAGKVVFATATRMRHNDAYDVIDALRVKYGAPDIESTRQIRLVRPDRVNHVRYKLHEWQVQGGAQALNIDPAGYTDPKEEYTYASIDLIDYNAYNNQWLPRFNGTANTSDL